LCKQLLEKSENKGYIDNRGIFMGMNEHNEIADRQKENEQYLNHTLLLASMDPIELNRESVGKRTLEYVKQCGADAVRPNLTGYALSLGTTPDELSAWINDKTLPNDVRWALRKGISIIESCMISMMMDQKINPVASIFLLKNHFGYKDQSEISFKGHIETSEKSLEAKYRAVVDDD